MAYTDAPLILSQSTYGESILITATSSPGTYLHTTAVSTSTYDYLELFVCNSHTADVQIFLRFNGVVDELGFIPFKRGYYRVTPPRPLKGGELDLFMYASVSNVISVFAGAGSSRITIT